MQRSRSLRTIVVGIVLFGLGLALGAILADKAAFYDDAFITLRYARNFAQGQGFVYTRGETVLGTSSPLYALTAGIVSRITRLDPLVVANWMSALSLAVAAWFAFKLIAADFDFLSAAVAGICVVINPFLISTWGGEWLVAMAALAAGFYYYRVASVVASAVAFAIAVLFRAEAFLGAAPVLAHALLNRRPHVVRALAVAASLLVVWLAVSWLVIGRVVPTTLATKVALGRSGWFTPFLTGAGNLSIQYFSDAGLLAIPLLAWPGALFALLKQRAVWGLIALWVVLHVAFYTGFQLAFYHWYLVPVVFGMSVGVGPGLAAIRAYVPLVIRSSLVAKMVAGVAMVAFSGMVVLGELRATRRWVLAKPDIREELYTRVGGWLADHTPPDATVAYVEVGRIGYYSRRRIVDQIGLVTAGVADKIAANDFNWPIYHYQPKYYLVNSIFGWVGSLTEQPWFSTVYQEAISFTSADRSMTLRVFEKRAGAEFPVPPDIETLQAHGQRVIGDMIAGHSYSQTFTASHNGLKSVATRLATYGRANHGIVRITIEQLDTRSVVHQEDFEMADVQDNEWRTVEFPAVEGSSRRRFRLTFQPLQSVPGNAVTAWYSATDFYKGGQYEIDGRAVAGDLTLRVAYATATLSGAQ